MPCSRRKSEVELDFSVKNVPVDFLFFFFLQNFFFIPEFFMIQAIRAGNKRAICQVDASPSSHGS